MPEKDNQVQYAQKEELANVLTHGIGIILSLIGTVILTLKALDKGDQWHLVSFIIFGISLLLSTIRELDSSALPDVCDNRAAAVDLPVENALPAVPRSSHCCMTSP